MEFWVLIAILLLIGCLFGWISFFKVRELESKFTKLTRDLNNLRETMSELRRSEILVSAPPPKSTENPQRDVSEAELTAPDMTFNEEQPPASAEAERKTQTTAESTRMGWPLTAESTLVQQMFSHFRDNWMLWIGGVSLALAGIFLARYAIQHGVIGPTGRIAAGIITGMVLHAAAEYLRRRLQNNHPSFAMLAVGGSITLFATLLAALHYYAMFSPMLVFIVLAIVAVITMWLSLIHGPILAAMGMVGAYVLPIMVSTGSGNVNVALVYSLIISLSILLLMQRVSRYWLWVGMLTGSLFWWMISLDSSSADLSRLWYLALLAYGILSVLQRDWSLSETLERYDGDRFYNLLSRQLPDHQRWQVVAILLVTIAHQLSVAVAGVEMLGFGHWVPMSLILLMAARNNQYLKLHSWLALVGFLLALVVSQMDFNSSHLVDAVNPELQTNLIHNLLLLLLLFSGLAIKNASDSDESASWIAMATLTPILVLIASHLLMPEYLTQNNWALTGLVAGALFVFIATTAKAKNWSTDWQVWSYFSGHFGYSFAAVMFLDDGTLTLAIALQLISLASIIKRFEIPELGWILKLVISIVLVRLSANPWLLDYSANNHWTLLTYGGTLIAAILAMLLLRPYPTLKRWVEGAAMHLLVLTIWVEVRYYLYSGVVFESDYSFTEASLMSFVFGLLSLVYYWRSSISEATATIYRYYSYLLMLFAWGSYSFILLMTFSNASIVTASIAETPIFNMLLLAYGFPVLLAMLAMKYFNPVYRSYFEYLAGLSAFVFINLEIRHLWQGNLNLALAASDGEFYSYSIVWLLAAIIMVLSGAYRFGKKYYQLGLSMLALVVMKVFIFDMSQLEGIYRIITFMGLGLCLLAMAYVHKKLILVLERQTN